MDHVPRKAFGVRAIAPDPIVHTVDAVVCVSSLLIASTRRIVPATIVLNTHDVMAFVQESQHVAAITTWISCESDRVAVWIATHADRVSNEEDILARST
jgi:hypothetical protein